MMRVLITGANGMLGGVVLAHLVNQGPLDDLEVIAVDRARPPGSEDDFTAIRQVTGDLLDLDLEGLFAAPGFDAVIHLAAITGQSAEQSAQQTRDINFHVTNRLLKLCCVSRPPCRFVFASSIAAIGAAKSEMPVGDDVACNPLSQYGKTKAACEAEIRKANGKGYPAWALRLPTLVLRNHARAGLPTSGYISDITCDLLKKGHARSPMSAQHCVAIASFDDASSVLCQLALDDIPSSAPAVMNLPAHRATADCARQAVLKIRECSISYAHSDNERIIQLTQGWPKAMSSKMAYWFRTSDCADGQQVFSNAIHSQIHADGG